jgi:hypothetical protein
MTQGCCAGCQGSITDGCAPTLLKVGLYFCNTCNSTNNPVCPPDVYGSSACDVCCQVQCGLPYSQCLIDSPIYQSDKTYYCEDGFPYYKMYASWRSGDLRNACITPGGHTYILEAMPAASIYNQPLKIPLSMYMAGSEITSDNTSAFVSSSYGDICGKPCNRTYGNDAACPQPCGRQDCGYPIIISAYAVPV